MSSVHHPHIRIGKVFTKLANIGVFLRENGFYEEAIDCFETLAGDDSDYENGDYAYQIGLSYEQMNNTEEARKYYLIAVSANPSILLFREAATRLGLGLPPDPAGPSEDYIHRT